MEHNQEDEVTHVATVFHKFSFDYIPHDREVERAIGSGSPRMKWQPTFALRILFERFERSEELR
jgi:hypothetical protein